MRPAVGVAAPADRGAGGAVGRARPTRRRIVVTGLLAGIAAVFVLSLVLGQSYTSPGDVLRVLLGEDVPGASFAVGRLRLPRAVLSLVCGLGFGMAGAAYQAMLRNSLASPDIIGISYSASAAAVVGIVFFSLSGAAVSTLAVMVSLGVAALIYFLSFKDGVSGTRLILVGIGIAALLESVIAYSLDQAGEWDLQEAIRWLAGSVNGASIEGALPVLIALPICGAILLAKAHDLEALRLGDEVAAGLGVRVASTRLIVLAAATVLVAFATAAAGPISFVAFLSGPIATQLLGQRGSTLVPAALTGALLVLAADYCGQFLLPSRFPVGVVTGALGAPFLIYLIVRSNRLGGSV